MFRLRRYRVFLICAAVILVGLVRLRSRHYYDGSSAGFEGADSLRNSFLEQSPAGNAKYEGSSSSSERKPYKPIEVDHGTTGTSTTGSSSSSEFLGEGSGVDLEPPAAESSSNSQDNAKIETPHAVEVENPIPTPTVNAIPPQGVPDRTIVTTPEKEETVEEIHFDYAGRFEPSGTPAPSEIVHWEKMPERFPVPSGSLIHLPTGTPLAIPRIQYEFSDETPTARSKREQRQSIIKDEFKRSWQGYKEKAWLHDELSPVTGAFRDPFSGWGATLVDALDTLWIMGLESEFEEAVKAVDQLDFTTSRRNDIPVFETTIRYLGGLLAAYDVSGGKYTSLLDKAVEMAEILMDAFDTPNRMPILFYHWKPAFASQPHRSSERSNLAEFGSLSMEFTRLAQITQQEKYYDAVARISNAFEEWQDRGTRIQGMFPADINGSGCNRTAPPPSVANKGKHTDGGEAQGYKPKMPANVAERIPPKREGPDGPQALELQVIPGQPGQPNKAVIDEYSTKELKHGVPMNADDGKVAKRQLDSAGQENAAAQAQATPTPPPQGIASKFDNNWDCKPQGLDSANSPTSRETFSLGGGHDSTYEYFPKQYLLLGGLVDQYRTMYLKVMTAVRKYLIYRPNVPGNPDILFSGRLSIGHDPKDQYYLRLTPEITHLTCFVGGMIGMSSRIFNIESDLELAKKLTDGCVWAYSSTQSGIMAEVAEVMTCKDITDCQWNETLWHQILDPDWDKREGKIQEYLKLKTQFQAEIEAEIAAQAQAAGNHRSGLSTPPSDSEIKESVQFDSDPSDPSDMTTQSRSEVGSESEPSKQKMDTSSSLSRRQVEEVKLPVTHDFREDQGVKVPSWHNSESDSHAFDYLDEDDSQDDAGVDEDDSFQKKLQNTEKQLKFEEDGRYLPATKTTNPVNLGKMQGWDDGAMDSNALLLQQQQEEEFDEYQPMTHEEFVQARIQQDGLPEGYTKLTSKKYILRPEAIESVWYMYRITGDTDWQDKGWAMWEAISRVTATQYGNSAIDDVTRSDGGGLRDEMESFWLAETLKYFYLLYSTPDTISLDDWVLNTEAHPFKRPS